MLFNFQINKVCDKIIPVCGGQVLIRCALPMRWHHCRKILSTLRGMAQQQRMRSHNNQ
jgi:hypothetical protein